ncbi:UTP4 protein, partial [Drymodes brunneopygia]|nr:UTP4 protein [Drymodes brunneopygia]
FFGLVPAGVRCLALHPRGGRLALARTDGAVAVFNFAANYFQEKVIPGHEARSVESLCWAAGERLFGAGLGGDITEYDLSRLSAARGVDGGGGPIWSMAANGTGTQLAIGCEDGSVKIFQVVPGGIQFERNLDRRKGQTVQRIMVNHHVEKAKRECVVWAIALLSSGTVVSADSFGRVQFWDWQQGTLAESHTVSTSAALSLAVSEKEDSIVVGTSTGATYQLQLLPVKLGGLEKRWVRTKPFQFHSHDVRAVAHSPSALISGGLDAQLVIRPLMEKVQKKGYDAVLRKFTFPHRRLVSCARKARLLLFQFSQYLELWRLGSTEETGKDGEVLPLCRMPEHLVQLKSKGPEHIYCSCVSPCGTWVGYSTASRLQLYRVRCDGDGVSLRKV